MRPLAADEPSKLTIAVEPLGDSDAGVVSRITFKFAIPPEVPQGVPLVIIGSATQQGQVVKRFRYPLLPSQRDSLTAIQTLQPGDAEIEARLMVPLEEQTPVIVAKTTSHFTIVKTNKQYVAGADPVVGRHGPREQRQELGLGATEHVHPEHAALH